MLRKLLKYEFKATGRLIGVIYLAVLVAAIVTGIIGRFSDATIDNPIAFMIFVAIYVILIVALIVITVLMIIERFYKNMLTGEGYLMHTLPVPTWMHVASKTISAFVWEIVAIAVLILSLVLCFVSGGIWKEIFSVVYLDEMLEALAQHRGLILLTVVATFVQLIRIILMFYASMAIGGSSTRHKIAFSVLAFILILIAINIVSTLANVGLVGDFVFGIEVNGADSAITFNQYMKQALVHQLIMDLVCSGVLFWLTNFFLKKKLNLE